VACHGEVWRYPFAQFELKVYINFEKNYKTYCRTWGGNNTEAEAKTTTTTAASPTATTAAKSAEKTTSTASAEEATTIASSTISTQQEQHEQQLQQEPQRYSLWPRPQVVQVDDAVERRARAEATRKVALQRATRIAKRAATEEAFVVQPSSSVNRKDIMEQLKSTTWLGKFFALQGLLGLVSKMSLNMQKVNVIPWELIEEQREFYDKLVVMEATLREQPSRESDPRRLRV
jgi:hypothetical protein